MGWTQGVYARDANGLEVPARDSRAVCWCAMGAIDAVTGADPDPGCAIVALSAIVDEIPDWNDATERTAEEVATAMEHAADAWEARNPGRGDDGTGKLEGP